MANPNNMFILTINYSKNLTKDYSKNFTTSLLLTIWHMPMFVVKCIVIIIIGLAYGSNNCTHA